MMYKHIGSFPPHILVQLSLKALIAYERQFAEMFEVVDKQLPEGVNVAKLSSLTAGSNRGSFVERWSRGPKPIEELFYLLNHAKYPAGSTHADHVEALSKLVQEEIALIELLTVASSEEKDLIVGLLKKKAIALKNGFLDWLERFQDDENVLLFAIKHLHELNSCFSEMEMRLFLSKGERSKSSLVEYIESRYNERGFSHLLPVFRIYSSKVTEAV